MPARLSADCFYDHCGECRDPACEDFCHRDQDYDWVMRGWAEREEDESDD